MHSIEIRLVEKAKDGDHKALNELFYREQKFIFNLMYRLTGGRAEADDLTQEAFIKAYQKIKSFRHEASFRTWLTKIAINIFRMSHRQEAKHKSICLGKIKMPAAEGIPERTVIKREMQWCISHSLQQHVPQKYRVVLILRDLQEFSYKEISEILGWSIGKVKTRIHRARQILRNHFINGKCKAFAKDYLCICNGILKL